MLFLNREKSIKFKILNSSFFDSFLILLIRFWFFLIRFKIFILFFNYKIVFQPLSN
jgi:hypothetical protein